MVRESLLKELWLGAELDEQQREGDDYHGNGQWEPDICTRIGATGTILKLTNDVLNERGRYRQSCHEAWIEKIGCT